MRGHVHDACFIFLQFFIPPHHALIKPSVRGELTSEVREKEYELLNSCFKRLLREDMVVLNPELLCDSGCSNSLSIAIEN